MATPSLKKMEGGEQEGIYASSNASYVGEVDGIDLGLTLLPGSQIQTECDKQDHAALDKVHYEREFLRELNNGSKRGIASKTRESTLHGNAHQDVCSQENNRDPVEIEPESNTVSKRHETTCAPGRSCRKTADGSGDRARSEPHKAPVVSRESARSRSCDWNDFQVQTGPYPVNVSVSEGSTSAARKIDWTRVRESVHGLIHSVEGESVVLGHDSGSGESHAEDSPEGLRPYKRQRTEEDLPCSLFYDLQDALVEQLDLGVDLWQRGLSNENAGVLQTEASGALRSRSHSSANDVVRVARGTGSEPQYLPPRPTSTLALETRSRSLSTPRSSDISSSHTICHSARPERSHVPLSSPPQASRAITTTALSTENRATSRQPHDEHLNSTAPSASIMNLSNAPELGDSFTLHSQPESALNERSPLLERLHSSTVVPLHDHQEPKRFPEPSVATNSLFSLPTQSNPAEVLHRVSFSTISSAQSPFTEHLDKCNNNSIHGNTMDNTPYSTTSQGDDLLLETALPYRIGPLPGQEVYESPYAPKSRRLRHLLGSQTEERNITPNLGYRNPMEHPTLEPAIAAGAPTPPPGSQYPHTATPIRSKTPSSRPIAQLRSAVQSGTNLTVPSPPAPSQSSVSKTGSPDAPSSEQDSTESDESSSESSSDESSAPTERIPVSPALVTTAKKGLHAITSVIVSRIHHADIVPRVISFIETFPPSSDPPAPPTDSLAPLGNACPADHMDLLYKNHSLFLRNHDLLQRNAVLQKERDRFKRAAREWATTDPESGLTKGQSMSREVRSLRSRLADKTAEAEHLRKAWFDFEASRSASRQWNYASPMLSGDPPSRANLTGREPRVEVVWQDKGPFTGVYEKRSFPTAEPTPPASKRVSIDLTEGTPDPSSTLANLPSAPSPPLPSSPAAATLRSTMKRKTYSWLPDKSNHMVTKPSPAARGKRPSTAIELDVEGPVFDAEAELEAELERELLASQHVEEGEQQRKRQRQQVGRQRRQKMTSKQKATKERRAKAATTTTARTDRVEEEPERLVAEQQQRVEDEQRQAEERERDEEFFGVEEEQQRKEAEERARDEELFGLDEEEPQQMVDAQVGAEGGWDEAAELALRRAMEESCEESEDE